MNADLFGASEAREIPDLHNEYLRETFGLPDGWQWYEFDASPDRLPPGFLRLRGAVVPIGPRTGRPNWRKMNRATDRTLFVERAKFEAWKVERAKSRDECIDCYGFGERVASMGVSGTTWAPCKRCGGSGKYAEGAR